MSIKTMRFGGFIASVAAAALVALPGLASAQHGGFGGGGHGGGGGGHFAGGGGGHFAGGGGTHFGGGGFGGAHVGGYGGGFGGTHYAAPHFSAAPRFGGGFSSSPRVSMAHNGYAPRYSAGTRYTTPHFAGAPSHAFGGASGNTRVAAASGWSGHASGWNGAHVSGWSGGHGSGWNGGHGSGWNGGHASGWSGWHASTGAHGWYGPRWGSHPYWNGGWWHGGWWPRAYYGWAFPWFFPVLPIGFTTFWWGGIPYYYVNSVYYTWDPSANGYVVTNPPPVAGDVTDDSVPPDAGGNPADQGSAGSADNIFMYPQNGQSQEQQSTDRYECHRWAQDQTGFDPTQPNGGTGSASPDDYRRAMIACLSARGYSVQ